MRIAAFVGGIAVGWLTASPVSAQGPAVTMRVLVENNANVPASIVADAERHASVVYRSAGVAVVWLNDARAALADGGTLDFTVMLASAQDTPALVRQARARNETLGFAAVSSTDRGHVAYALYGRIEDWAGRRHLFVSSLLGEVMAHELGHLLLGDHNHSESGIMRANWELRSGVPDHFTKAQGEAIRQCLLATWHGEGRDQR